MTSWGIAIACFVLLAVLWNRSKPKILWIIKPMLAAMGAASFANTGFGGTVAGWMLGALGWVGSWFGISGPVVAGILVVALALVVVLDILFDRVANGPAIGSLFVLPLLFLVAAGPIAASGQTISDNVARAGTSSVGRLVGG